MERVSSAGPRTHRHATADTGRKLGPRGESYAARSLRSHNDSGDGPNLYTIDASGRLLATFQIAGAEARDWEDMSSGPCVGDLAPAGAAAPPVCLYLADIGDNDRVREWLTVYVVVEPLAG